MSEEPERVELQPLGTGRGMLQCAMQCRPSLSLLAVLGLCWFSGRVQEVEAIVDKARGARDAGATTFICPEENAQELKVWPASLHLSVVCLCPSLQERRQDLDPVCLSLSLSSLSCLLPVLRR